MRFIHTSDWHLGADLNGHSRLAEQKIFLEFLLAQCVEKEIDALIVAGDIFDVNQPSIASQELLHSFIASFYENCSFAHMIIIGGNHDSGNRLNSLTPLTQMMKRIHIIGKIDARDPNLQKKCILPIGPDHTNPLGVCIALPFLRIGDLQTECINGDSIGELYSKATETVYRELAQTARAKFPNCPCIGTGHLTLTQSTFAGSEIQLIGGIDSIPASLLAPYFDYLALGHIHRPQSIAEDKIRYCGSPYPIAFDESKYAQKILYVDLQRTLHIEEIQTPRTVDFLTMVLKEGDLETLKQYFIPLKERFQEINPQLHPFVKIQITDPLAKDLWKKNLEEILKDTPLRMASGPQFCNAISTADKLEPGLNELRLQDSETPYFLLNSSWEKSMGSPCPPEIRNKFTEILQSCRTEVEL